MGTVTGNIKRTGTDNIKGMGTDKLKGTGTDKINRTERIALKKGILPNTDYS